MSFDTRHQLLDAIDRLSLNDQERLLEVAQKLEHSHMPDGTTWDELQMLRGIMPREDAEEMKRSIEEEYERIDPDRW